jgi:uncharacterized membrane protein
MALHTHELHPSMVHMPLALLPMAALVDLAAAMRPRDRTLDRLGCRLWWLAAGTGLATGLAGMAASQEIDPRDPHTRDMTFLHGIGNLGLVLAAFGVATLRTGRRATFASAAGGLLASGAAMYTAYLGGELVYAHGVGVRQIDRDAERTPLLLSAEGARRLAVDAGRGLGWLLARAYRAVSGQERVDRTALGPIAEAGTGGEMPSEAP